MDGWMNEQISEWLDGWMDEWMPYFNMMSHQEKGMGTRCFNQWNTGSNLLIIKEQTIYTMENEPEKHSLVFIYVNDQWHHSEIG